MGAGRRENPTADGEPPRLSYSFRGIEHLRRRLSADDEAWRRYFLRSAIEPLELYYETDVEPDPTGAVARILSHIEVDVPSEWKPETRMVRQSDQLNDERRSAYDRDATVRLSA